MAIPPTPILSYGTRSPHRPRWRALRRRDSEGGTPGGMNNKGAILIAVALAGYGVLSISMTLGFKSALSAFPYPCALVAATFVLEAALVKSAECGARCSDVVHARKCDGDDASNDDGRRWLMLLIGACVGGEVALSNAGLLLLSVATHTMIKACTPVFVLAAALALGLEPPSCASFGIVATIASGTALSSVGSAGDGEDSLIGVLLTVGGGAIGGLRWGLTQRATQTGEAKVAPTALVRRTLPFSAACLVAAAAAIDGYRIAKAPGAGAAALDAMGVAGALAVGGLALLTVEVALVALTSSLSLAVAAVAKELVLVAVAALSLGDEVLPRTLVGFGLTASGVLAYNLQRLLRRREDGYGRVPAEGEEAAEPPEAELQRAPPPLPVV
mmetsp:Transcript_13210/g.40691  ORF Transcript_13210/g.40691 Transcript_13210/m.40691 type:complete len:386 (-) Transcript_13210:26-1183(-)